MHLFDGLHSCSTGRTQADNCNDLLCGSLTIAVMVIDKSS